jgi:AraC-like DNA-binding protein
MPLSDKDIVHQVKNLLIQNIRDEHFGCGAICHELGLSRTSLHRIIKRNTYFSTSLYIRRIRLEQAKSFLINSNMRISEIAYEVGFTYHQNFSKYFTSSFDLSPTEFRKQMRTST